MGSSWTTEPGVAQPYVGMGTMLCIEGRSIDLTGATSIAFKIRSHTGPLDLRLKIASIPRIVSNGFRISQRAHLHPLNIL